VPDAPATPDDPRPSDHRRIPVPRPITVALLSLAAAMLIVTVLVQLVADDPTPDVREILDEDGEGAAGATTLVPSELDPGDPAPAATLEWLGGGEPATLDQVVTAPTVVNFWSSSCAPCRTEMPAFDAVHRSSAGVTVVGVDVNDTEAAGAEMVERTGVTYRNARDPRGELLAAFGGSALPYTVVLDTEGTIVDEHVGALSEAELLALLREHGIAT
jgi:thiol-disulfide isomerase/thioredoxin